MIVIEGVLKDRNLKILNEKRAPVYCYYDGYDAWKYEEAKHEILLSVQIFAHASYRAHPH